MVTMALEKEEEDRCNSGDVQFSLAVSRQIYLSQLYMTVIELGEGHMQLCS